MFRKCLQQNPNLITFGTDNVFNTVYVNDMTEGVSSYISFFADDAKLL